MLRDILYHFLQGILCQQGTRYATELCSHANSALTLTVREITKFETHGFISRALFKLKLSLWSAIFADTLIKLPLEKMREISGRNRYPLMTRSVTSAGHSSSCSLFSRLAIEKD